MTLWTWLACPQLPSRLDPGQPTSVGSTKAESLEKDPPLCSMESQDLAWKWGPEQEFSSSW